MDSPQSYTVVGAGGIGCALSYSLLAAGCPLLLVESDITKIAWGRAHGVCVDGLPSLPAQFVAFEEWNPLPSERVLLCTKCYDNPAVLARLPSGATVIPVQNGFDPSFNSRGNFAEGIASFVSECIPGRTHTCITRKGSLHLGVHRNSSHRQDAVAAARTVAEMAAPLAKPGLFPVEIVTDILPFKHTKLIYNAAIGPLAAAAGLDNGQLLSMRKIRKLFFALLRENYSILQSAGVSLGKIGPFHPSTVDLILRAPSVAWALSWAFYPSLRGTYCSMHADLPRGKTEIDFYNGYLIELAGKRPCPLNLAIYDLIKSMEREHSRPGLEAVDRLCA
jgi:2-dehydropantoate 2-reductase